MHRPQAGCFLSQRTLAVEHGSHAVRRGIFRDCGSTMVARLESYIAE